MLTWEKSTNIIDIAQDHSGHFCLHKRMMKDQPKSWEVAKDGGDYCMLLV